MQFPCVCVFYFDVKLLWGMRGTILPLSKLSILASKLYFLSDVLTSRLSTNFLPLILV